MTQKTIELITTGQQTHYPVFCIIRDSEQLVLSKRNMNRDSLEETEHNVQWKIVESMKDSGVTYITPHQAHDLIDALGLVPALTMRGYGKLYDTPDRAFLSKFRGKKVYVTT